VDESAEYDYADDFDDDAHDGTDRALDPLLNPPSVPKSVGVSAELLIDGGDLGWMFSFYCSGYGGQEEGFHEARAEAGSRESAPLGVRGRPHLPRDLLTALQAGIRFPYRYCRACVQVHFNHFHT
jgi:hypothetical protein